MVEYDSDIKSIIIDYISCFLKTPYVIGGAGPWGLDCSGLIVEAFKSVGMLGNQFDTTAQGLFDIFSDMHRGQIIEEPEAGALVFFGKSRKLITHIGFCRSERFMIEAGGGDNTTVDNEAAKKKNAFVRMRPVAMRKDLVAIIMPRY